MKFALLSAKLLMQENNFTCPAFVDIAATIRDNNMAQGTKVSTATDMSPDSNTSSYSFLIIFLPTCTSNECFCFFSLLLYNGLDYK